MDYLLRSMQNLQMLNGIRVERDALFSSYSEEGGNENQMDNDEEIPGSSMKQSEQSQRSHKRKNASMESLDTSMKKIQHYLIENNGQSSNNQSSNASNLMHELNAY